MQCVLRHSFDTQEYVSWNEKNYMYEEITQ